jgi:hypothetical protein
MSIGKTKLKYRSIPLLLLGASVLNQASADTMGTDLTEELRLGDLAVTAYETHCDSLTENDPQQWSLACEAAKQTEPEIDAEQVSAVPLPATLWLFGSVLAGFMATSNRRKV